MRTLAARLVLRWMPKTAVDVHAEVSAMRQRQLLTAFGEPISAADSEVSCRLHPVLEKEENGRFGDGDRHSFVIDPEKTISGTLDEQVMGYAFVVGDEPEPTPEQHAQLVEKARQLGRLLNEAEYLSVVRPKGRDDAND